MEATYLYFSATSSFLFLCVGIIAGWTAKNFMHDYFYTREEEQQITMHPEMYDQQGQYIHEELYSVKFVDEDDLDETID